MAFRPTATGMKPGIVSGASYTPRTKGPIAMIDIYKLDFERIVWVRVEEEGPTACISREWLVEGIPIGQ